MTKEKKEITVSPEKEILEFTYFGEQFTDKQVLDTLLDIDRKGKEMEVGGQTTYQNRFFVLNPVEFPEGSSHKSRQAIFEASVRVDNLKSLLFEYKKAIAEQKIIEVKRIRKMHDIERIQEDVKHLDATEEEKVYLELDITEAEAELDILDLEKRQKEIALENIIARSKHTLRAIYDFHGEFVDNEKLCEKRGFTYKDWNRLEVEHDAWMTINDRKVQKMVAYSRAGLTREGGDSLPLQNTLDPERIQQVKQVTIEAIEKEVEEKKSIENKGSV
jgi:hypothetical protein